MTTWMRSVALVLAALAFASPVGAQTEHAELGHILGERAQAAANLSTQVENARASALARSELESALTARGQALNEALVASQPSVDRTGAGFDWTAAGGGAGATLVLVLGALGSVFLVRRGRRAATGAA